jgi:mitochondrial enoyl-[acyl-carrier protein] reductase / trans-2-enoyl-CoA reductase
MIKAQMSETINAAIYETHGKPTEVLQVREVPRPRAGEGEVVVEMQAAPINPADLNAIEGKYPLRPTLPATPGFEGSGFVTERGKGTNNMAIGTLVILPHDAGTWREALAVKTEKLVAVPDGIDPKQAAMLKINPITAWRMLHDFVELKHGDWLIQNAANSAAGRAVIQISRELGYKSVNVVRRSELVDELRTEGGDVVLVDNEKLRDEVKEATGGAPIRLALNAVGGENALRVANALAPEATMVTYGAMSFQPLRIPNGLLIFKNLRFCGFWVNKWYDQATVQQRDETFAAIFEMAQRGLLKTKVEKSYSLGEAKAALEHAAQNKRGGKIIFEFAG